MALASASFSSQPLGQMRLSSASWLLAEVVSWDGEIEFAQIFVRALVVGIDRERLAQIAERGVVIAQHVVGVTLIAQDIGVARRSASAWSR